MPSEIKVVVDVEATIKVQNTAIPPEITFSFPGLQDPVHLWEELAYIGWKIPDRPEHPNAEIDWDDPSGSKYQVVAYRVEDFEITADNWPQLEVGERGILTVNLLRRLGVDLNVPVPYLDFLRRTQVAINNDPTRTTEVVKPATIPTSVMLSKQPFSALTKNEAINLYETVSGPNQPNWYWAESPRPAFDITRSEKQEDELFSTVDLGWELVSRAESPAVRTGKDRTLRFLVRDMDVGSAMLEMASELSHQRCSSLLMRPLKKTGAFGNCLLVVAVVPKAQFSEVGQKLLSHFPDAIGRGRRYDPSRID